jgi:hypothetical protein
VGDPRLERLARRVEWLDRYRRVIAVALAIVLAALLMWQLPVALGDDWPRFHARLLGIMCGIACWCVVEIGLAWLAALWETEHDRALRSDPEFPRASVFRRRRK